MSTVTDKDAQDAPSPYAYLMEKRNKSRPPTSWHLKPLKNMNIWELFLSLDLADPVVYEEKPADFDRGPLQDHPMWKENLFVLTVGLIPIYLQYASYKIWPDFQWKPWPTYFFYHLCFTAFAITNVKRLHYFMLKYGTFDETVRARDLCDDKHANHLGASILLYTILRTCGVFIMKYDQTVAPTLTWKTIPKICLWLIAVDFLFYIYHSACHRVDSLWFIHRAHHGTKHPTPILSLLADDYQEIIEVILCPLGASYMWVIYLLELIYTMLIHFFFSVEMNGHSGIRANWPHPLLHYPLKPFGMELQIEDHDLHHRYGRDGLNYGKQTRIWDRLCGTTGNREEAKRV